MSRDWSGRTQCASGKHVYAHRTDRSYYANNETCLRCGKAVYRRRRGFGSREFGPDRKH